MSRPAATPLVEAAPAKINLTLRVVGRRADGYHLLDGIVAFADVGERLTLEPAAVTELLVEGPGYPSGASPAEPSEAPPRDPSGASPAASPPPHPSPARGEGVVSRRAGATGQAPSDGLAATMASQSETEGPLPTPPSPFAGEGWGGGAAPGAAPALGPVADNLVMRADAAFRARRPGVPPLRYRLTKAIPVAAGLGGGSADAAAALRGLARLGEQPEAVDLAGLAAGLGADVPVCLASRAARIAGIGERVAPLAALPPLVALLVHPGVALATPQVFAAFDATERPPPSEPAPADTLLAEILAGGNDLEAAARGLVPVIGELLDRIAVTEGCLAARMTGSGAACFGLYASRAGAEAARARLATERPDWWLRAAPLV